MAISVQKQLAGVEDLLLGQGQVNQDRGGTGYPISKLNSGNIPYSGDQATNDFVSLLEKIMPRGTLPLPVTGGIVTLTAAQFSNTAFDLTGVLTANLTLVIPDGLAQMFIIDNATTGAFTVTVKHAATAGIVVPQATREIVYTTGLIVESLAASSSPTATQVAFTPDVNITSLDVQAAIAQVYALAVKATEKNVANGVATTNAQNELVQMIAGAAAQVAAGNPTNVVRADGTWGVAGEANLAIATLLQAQAGTDNTTNMTPLRVNDAIKVLAQPHLTNNISFLSKSPGNVFSILMDGKLYNAHAKAGTWGHPTGRTTDTGYALKFGVQDALIRVPFKDETGKIIQTGNTGIHCFALFANGNLYTWGSNKFGALGLGDTVAHWYPTLSATGVTEVFDPQHYGMYWQYIRYFIKKTDGTIWGAGHNGYGALGDGTTVNKSTWTQITSLGTNTTKLFNMGGFAGCTFALKADGTIWACGYNGYGTLGDGTTTVRLSFVDVTTAWGGVAADIMQMGGGFSYSAGTLVDNRTHAVMLRKDAAGVAAVYTCGNSTWGTRGDGGTINVNSTPYVVPNTDTAVEIAVFGGGAGTINVRLANNTMLAWGYNYFGQVGSGNTTQQTTPLTVKTDCAKLLNDGNDAYSQGHYIQAFYVNTLGELMGCGYNSHGELALGDLTHRNVFTKIPMPADEGSVTDLGFFTSTGTTKNYIAKTTSGKLYCWGYGGQQNLAAHLAHVVTPTQVVIPQA